ncbi:MAG: hypothetical protein Tsb0021_05200 [Chlamydiales bacterium]
MKVRGKSIVKKTEEGNAVALRVTFGNLAPNNLGVKSLKRKSRVNKKNNKLKINVGELNDKLRPNKVKKIAPKN